MRKVVLFFLVISGAFSIFPLGAGAGSFSNGFQSIKVQGGRLSFEDGQQVALFGVNYYPMSWWEYTYMKALGADFKKEIRTDVSEMKKCGIDVVRVHFFESEICDLSGNIHDNKHLELFDYLVNELDRQGIYLYLTLLTWWDTPHAREDAYTRHMTKMGMIYREDAIVASENYIKQFLKHINPYTGKKIIDMPGLAVIDIINEPWYWPYESVSDADFTPGFIKQQCSDEDYDNDLVLWRRYWDKYCKVNACEKSNESYEKLHHEVMTNFISRMHQAIKSTGAKQPVAISLFESCERNKGILKAIGDSEVEIVVDGWYPGGFETLHETVNQMPVEAGPKVLPAEVKDKARIVYEFDICRTYNNVIMYPAYARRYKGMGAQIVCQFQYDPSITSQYNTDWGCHYLNYLYTPSKAVGFKIAAETFKAVPLYEDFPIPGDNEVFHGTALSFENKLTMRVDGDAVYYANAIENYIPLDLPNSPKYIMGVSNSPYVKYTGTGLYEIEVINDKIVLVTNPNAEVQGAINNEFFSDLSLDKPKVKLNKNEETMKINLPGWGKYISVDEQGKRQFSDGQTIKVIPGKSYILIRLDH